MTVASMGRGVISRARHTVSSDTHVFVIEWDTDEIRVHLRNGGPVSFALYEVQERLTATRLGDRSEALAKMEIIKKLLSRPGTQSEEKVPHWLDAAIDEAES